MLTLQNGPSISLWLTLFGVVAGFLSTFWSFGYTRLSRRLYKYLSTGPDDHSKRVKKTDVLNTLMRGSWINVLGLGSTLLGLQATVGLLVAKTLTNATANPFLAGGAGSYNPVLALDVFLVQVCSLLLLAHAQLAHAQEHCLSHHHYNVRIDLQARLLAALNIGCIHAFESALTADALGESWGCSMPQGHGIGCYHDLHGHENTPCCCTNHIICVVPDPILIIPAVF